MKQKVKLRIVRVSSFINQNTGFLIVLTLIIFGFVVIGFQKDNRLILEDTHAAVENTNRLLEQREAERIERELGVQRVITENTRSDEQQTMILCTLILRSDLIVSDQEALSIEQVCEAEVQRFQDRGRALEMSEAEAQPGEPSQMDQQQPNNQGPPVSSPSTPPSQNETPPPPPPEDRTTIGGFLNDVQEAITNLSCGALGVFC